MKEDTFYVTYPFMINDLKLKGIEKDVYAVIYGFCKDGRKEFSGSLKYLRECTNASENTVKNSLKNLLAKGYIIKTSDSNYKANTYTINFEKIPPSKIDPVPPQNLTPSPSKIDPNIYSNNITDNDIYSHVVSSFNKFCPSLEKVKDITTTTKKQIDILIEKGYKEDDFAKAFVIAERSSFLTGKKGSFNATLGWVLKPENFENVRHQKKYVDFDKKPMLEFDLSGAINFEEDYECFVNDFDSKPKKENYDDEYEALWNNFDVEPEEEEKELPEEKPAVSDDENLLSPEEARELAKKYLSPELYEKNYGKYTNNIQTL